MADTHKVLSAEDLDGLKRILLATIDSLTADRDRFRVLVTQHARSANTAMIERAAALKQVAELRALLQDMRQSNPVRNGGKGAPGNISPDALIAGEQK